MRATVITFLTLLVTLLFSIGASSAETMPGKTDVAVDKPKWTITFDQPIDFETVDGEVSLIDDNGDTISMTLEQQSDDQLLVIPNREYDYETTYQLTIGTGVESAQGEPLQELVEFQFTTASQVEDVAVPAWASDIVTSAENTPRLDTLDNHHRGEWHMYRESSIDLRGLAYEGDDLVGGFTKAPGDDIAGVAVGDSLSDYEAANLGDAESILEVGDRRYQFDGKGERYLHTIDGHQVIYYYDVHDDRIATIQWLGDQYFGSGGYHGTLSNVEDSEQLMMYLINQERALRDYNTLTLDSTMSDIARDHAIDMKERDYFAHDTLEGITPRDRMEESGYPLAYSGENIAAGQGFVLSAHEGLMNSEDHRDNLLFDDYDYIGVGITQGDSTFTNYFAQNFYSLR
ncbi:hypothetical protein ABID56_001030 [Alkalibacillus flavidus]|uniref:Serine protease n=1 Tax=Alkalibacillus flavidus TaxID=546021 RepID=A0ABV2KTM7_9BACI